MAVSDEFLKRAQAIADKVAAEFNAAITKGLVQLPEPKPEPGERIFITKSRTHGDHVFCEDCIPADVDLAVSDTQVHREYSHDWLAAPVCRVCQLSLPVYIDGV